MAARLVEALLPLGVSVAADIPQQVCEQPLVLVLVDIDIDRSQHILELVEVQRAGRVRIKQIWATQTLRQASNKSGPRKATGKP